MLKSLVHEQQQQRKGMKVMVTAQRMRVWIRLPLLARYDARAMLTLQPTNRI